MQALPSDVVLLHIGPHKTGTTAFQSAFVAARKQVAEHGVYYAGRRRQPWLAALAVTGRRGRPGDPAATDAHWQSLVTEVRRAGKKGRVVVSSERFCDAKPDAIRRLVDDLGGPRVHILVTLRPLSKILPSQWQQAVRNGLPMPYRTWLRQMLGDERSTKVSPTFWHRHAHGELVERWAAVVGPERVVVLVLDESDRDMYLRATEQLLELPPGILVAQPSLANRSLTAGEVEMLRLLNKEIKARAWPGEVYARYVRLGLVKNLLTREPSPDERMIATPEWALERAGDLGTKAADVIASSGVTVIGDLGTLGRVSRTSASTATTPADVAPAAAAIALVGTIEAAMASPWPERYSSLQEAGQRAKVSSRRPPYRRILRRARRVLARIT